MEHHIIDNLFQPVKGTRPSDVVADQMRELILNGPLMPGDRLPSDEVLAKRFGVSKTSVRQALRQLEQQGMVEIRKGMHGGVFVAAADGRAMAQSLKLLLRLRRVPLEHMKEVRLLIEPRIARHAAERADPAWLEKMERAVQGMKTHLHSQARFEKFDEMFHQLLGDIQDNPILEFMATALVEVMRESFTGIDCGEVIRRRLARAHERVFKAIRRGDVAGAERAMLDLINGSTRWMAPLVREWLRKRGEAE